MPDIKPISDLRNYTEVLKEVDTFKRVYLTRNGHGAYAIMPIEDADELDRLRAANALVSNLKKIELNAQKDGWLTDDEMQEIMGIDE